MSRDAITRICMVSPDPARAERLRSGLANRPAWGAGLEYDTCDPQTLLLNLHRFNPSAFIIDLDLGAQAVSDLTRKLSAAGYDEFLFLGSDPGTAALPGEILPPDVPLESLLVAVSRLTGKRGRAREDAANGTFPSRRPTFVSLYSPKGGTGKTMLACALAVQFSVKGLRVAMVDLAMYGGVGPSFGLSKRDTGFSRLIEAMEKAPGLLRAFTDAGQLRESLTHYPVGDQRLDLLLPAAPLKMAGLGSYETESVLQWLAGEPYDVVIVDTSSEISERTMAALKMADHALMVITPEPAAAWAVFAVQNLLGNVNTEHKIQLVVNRSTGTGKIREYEDVLGYRVMGQIPETDHPWEKFVGRSMALNYTPSGMAFKQLAQQIHKVYSPIELPAVNR